MVLQDHYTPDKGHSQGNIHQNQPKMTADCTHEHWNELEPLSSVVSVIQQLDVQDGYTWSPWPTLLVNLLYSIQEDQQIEMPCDHIL